MRLTIFKRLAIGHMIILSLIVFMGGYITGKLNKLHQITWKTAAVDGERISTLEHLLSSVFSIVMFEKKYLISMDPDYYIKFQELQSYFAKDMQKIRTLLDTDEQINLINRAQNHYETYLTQFNKEIEAINNGQKPEKSTDLSDIKKETISHLNNTLNQIINLIKSERDDNIHLSNQMSQQTLHLTALITVLTIVLGFIISIFNTRNITTSITLLKKKTEEIAEGRFEKIESIKGPKEIQDLSSHFNAMCKRLQELDTMKADFISHVSHELRTPITAIKEASTMLSKGLYKENPEKQKELLNLIPTECERLINSVNRILDLSRMEGKMMDYSFKPCDLTEIIRYSILKLVPLIQKKNIDLELIPPPSIPLIDIDEDRMNEVMENLLANAIKFTSSGGKIMIQVNPVTEDNEVTVSVSDNGCGIKTKNLEDIFNKFKRIENGMETQRGTGLGLSITKHIVTAHGGKIWAESKYSKGTKVLFTLPVSSS